MRIAPALLLAAILAAPFGACYRASAPDLDTDQIAPVAAGQAGTPLPTPSPGPLDLAEVFKIPPQRVQSGSTNWYIACTWDRVYFAPGSADILPDTAACLRQMVRRIGNAYPHYVHASTDRDEVEALEARIDLIRRRTANVVDFLARYGVWVEAGSIEVSLGLDMLRTPDMCAADYHQEFRIAIVPTYYP